MPDQSPSWPECQAARLACQEAIYRRLDGLQARVDHQHQETLDGLLAIKEALAERRGRESAEYQAVRRRWSWKEVGAAIAVIAAAVAAAVVAAWRMAGKAGGG